jgi:hypothetical protein
MRGKINLIPSIADVIFVALLIRFSFAGSGLLRDGDTGFHIRAGEFIIDTLSVPRHDIFSYLSPPAKWTPHEWLSDVIMAFFHGAFGLTGVVIFFCFLIASVYCLLFKVIRTHNGNNIISAIIIILFVIASSQLHFLARPHIFSLLLLVVWYYLLDAYQYDDRNYLYFLPPIMLLWVNLHGAFIIGPLLIGVYLFGNIVFSLTSGDAEKKKCKQKARNLALTMVACLIISLINPYGYHILPFPFEISSNKIILDNVQEFLSPDFHKPLPYKYLFFLLIAIFAISRASLNIIEIVLVLLFTNMALFSMRHIPLFAIIVAPVLTRQIDLILNRGDGRFARFIKKRSENSASIDASSKGHLWPLGVSLVVVIFFAVGMMEYKFDEKRKPVDAVEFLKRENIPGNMFNKDEFGDYIIYAAWPKYKVFIDGRLLPPEKALEFLKVMRIEPGMDEVFKKYDINWIIFGSGTSLSYFLLQSDDWKLIYSDVVANIFVRNTAENQGLIEKYKNTKQAES